MVGPFHLRALDRFYYEDNKGQVNDLCQVAVESGQVTENHFLSSWSSEEHRQLTVCCYILSESFQFPLHGNYPTQLSNSLGYSLLAVQHFTIRIKTRLLAWRKYQQDRRTSKKGKCWNFHAFLEVPILSERSNSTKIAEH